MATFANLGIPFHLCEPRHPRLVIELGTSTPTGRAGFTTSG